MSKEKIEDKPLELYWIDWCYDELIDEPGAAVNEKRFHEGYLKARKIVEDYLARKKINGGNPPLIKEAKQ